MFCSYSFSYSQIHVKNRKLFCRFKSNNKMLALKTKKRVTKFLFALGALALSIGSVVWVANFIGSLHKYDEYCEIVRQRLELPVQYYAWEWGKKVNITFVALLFLWIPFSDHFLRKIIYPFWKKKMTYKDVKRYSRSVSRSLYEKNYGLVLGYFMRVNRKVNAKISLWFMKLETFEHVHFLIKVFKWIVLPSSILYGYATFMFFGLNVLDSILIANLMFFYSSFVPDLPAIFRRKIYHDVRDGLHKELPNYKSYALLLLAPAFIILIFCGKNLKWKTTETFHNFKSMAIYGIFLFILGFLFLLAFTISIGSIIKATWVLLFALLGYVTHLKVDMIF